MGKGDRRTKRGKIFRGSFGKFRPSKSNKSYTAQPPAKETAPVDESTEETSE